MKDTRIREIIVKEFLNGNTKIRNLVESAAYEHMKRTGDIEDVLDRVAEMLIEEAITDCKVHRDYIEDVLDDINKYEEEFHAKKATSTTKGAVGKDVPWSLE